MWKHCMGPHFALVQQSLEKIHWRALKLIPTIWHLPYTDRLVSLKLPSLQYRRWRGNLILMYKVTHKLTGIGRSIFIFRDTFHTTRGQLCKVSSVLYTTMLELNFSCTIVTMWNNLPSDIIIEASSVNSMLVLNLLDYHWNNINSSDSVFDQVTGLVTYICI